MPAALPSTETQPPHDRLFKELLTTFFVEFLELFFPKLAAELEPDSVEFLDKEIFISLFDGQEYEADIVARARFKGTEAFFLIHIENQSTPQAAFGRRMFRYFTAFFEKFDLPVYPIVVSSPTTSLTVPSRMFSRWTSLTVMCCASTTALCSLTACPGDAS